MVEINKIYNEDCLNTMARMSDGFVDLVITSPPYDDIRTYNGYSFDFERVAKEIFRIVKRGGIIVWVVDDQTVDFCESLTSFKQVIYFVEHCGLKLLDTMIYHKSNYAPAHPNVRRYSNTFEYMFVFSVGRPEVFNPIQEGKVFRGRKKERSWFRQRDGSQILKIIDCDRKTKDAENVWTICPTKPKEAEDHPAVFPEALVSKHIRSWTNKGDLIYDPFMGSGTVVAVAIKLQRRYVGSEISERYCNIAVKRVAKTIEKQDRMAAILDKY